MTYTQTIQCRDLILELGKVLRAWKKPVMKVEIDKITITKDTVQYNIFNGVTGYNKMFTVEVPNKGNRTLTPFWSAWHGRMHTLEEVQNYAKSNFWLRLPLSFRGIDFDGDVTSLDQGNRILVSCYLVLGNDKGMLPRCSEQYKHTFTLTELEFGLLPGYPDFSTLLHQVHEVSA